MLFSLLRTALNAISVPRMISGSLHPTTRTCDTRRYLDGIKAHFASNPGGYVKSLHIRWGLSNSEGRDVRVVIEQLSVLFLADLDLTLGFRVLLCHDVRVEYGTGKNG